MVRRATRRKPAKRAAPAKPKNLFRVGWAFQCKHSGKVYRVERIDTLHGERFLLRSLESGNPGVPKNVHYLNLQIEDGELVRVKKPTDYTKLRHVGDDVVVFRDPTKLETVPA